MDLTSIIEMSALNYNKDITKPVQASNLSVSPSTIPLQTSAATAFAPATYHPSALPPSLTPKYGSHSLTNPFIVPFQTLIVRSHTSTSTVKLFVRTSTLNKIPFFSQKLENGKLNNDEEFYMVDELYDACSLGLLFGLIQDQAVPDLVGHDVDIGGNEERVSAYVRAYPVAGKLGLEDIQNQIVDRLIAHYLEHPVSATDIGILARAGVSKSKFGTLLMRELARGMIDGIYHANLQERDIGSEKTTEDHDLSTENAQACHGGTIIGISSHNNQVSDSKEHVLRLRPSTPARTSPEHNSLDRDIRHTFANTESSTTLVAGNTAGSLTTATNSTIDLSIENTVLEQIQQSWTIEDATILMAMMVEAHIDAKAPTNRSPMEIAAAEPCKIHVHVLTETCPRQKSATGHKRKRAVSAWDVSNNEESGDEESHNDFDEEDDSSSVHSSSSEIIEVHSETTKSDKENSAPNSGASVGAKKEGGLNDKVPRPEKKRRKLGWLFR